MSSNSHRDLSLPNHPQEKKEKKLTNKKKFKLIKKCRNTFELIEYKIVAQDHNVKILALYVALCVSRFLCL